MHEAVKMMLIAGCGGFVGAGGRYLVSRWAPVICNGTFPTGTFIVNMAGCLLIGLFMGLGERHGFMSAAERMLLVTGFCGGFTTFSTFAADLWGMAQRSDWAMLTAYAAVSVVLGVALVVAGRAIAAGNAV